MCMYVVFCKIDHCIHIHWCIVMGLRHNDHWVESHMWPQQTWGQRSSTGQWPLVQVFGKKGQCIHILWCIFKSNITMIAKVCDRESRRDTWFENRLVTNFYCCCCFHATYISNLDAWCFVVIQDDHIKYIVAITVIFLNFTACLKVTLHKLVCKKQCKINSKLQFRFWLPFDHFWVVKTARLKPGFNRF